MGNTWYYDTETVAFAAYRLGQEAVHREDAGIGNSKEFWGQAGKEVPVDRNRGQHSGMQSVQNLEAVINEGLRVALLEKTPDQSLEVLLEHLGKALKGERTYIFERNEAGGDDNTYEWTAEGVEPEKKNLQNVPPQVCANWYRNFSIGRHIVGQRIEGDTNSKLFFRHLSH